MVKTLPPLLAFASLLKTVIAINTPKIGKAIVINQCPYPIYLHNIPSANGGFNPENATLGRGGTYTQQYTQLSNNAGWSIKLSNRPELVDLLQYEYTFTNNGSVYFDLSEVDRVEWYGHWMITADLPGCVPRQVAYQFPTDDLRAMQACEAGSSVTVTLCHGLPLPVIGAPSSVTSSTLLETGSPSS